MNSPITRKPVDIARKSTARTDSFARVSLGELNAYPSRLVQGIKRLAAKAKRVSSSIGGASGLAHHHSLDAMPCKGTNYASSRHRRIVSLRPSLPQPPVDTMRTLVPRKLHQRRPTNGGRGMPNDLKASDTEKLIFDMDVQVRNELEGLLKLLSSFSASNGHEGVEILSKLVSLDGKVCELKKIVLEMVSKPQYKFEGGSLNESSHLASAAE